MILAIYGAGGFGRDVLSLALQINMSNSRWEKFVFIDDVTNEEHVRNVLIYSFESFQRKFTKETVEIVIALGEPVYRDKLFVKVKDAGFSLATLVHPNVYVPEDTMINEGSMIYSNAFISSSASIGKNVAVMSLTAVGHGCMIGDHSILCTGAVMGGESHIAKNTFVSMAASIKEKVSIGCNVVIGLGAAVFRDIPDGVVVIGNPARIVAKNTGKVFG